MIHDGSEDWFLVNIDSWMRGRVIMGSGSAFCDRIRDLTKTKIGMVIEMRIEIKTSSFCWGDKRLVGTHWKMIKVGVN